ncbi:hypothetical protein KVT40_004285 [Elsinoe batatas]|uniref:LysM domain-containing protein n=1 Tax=Elsinoe batatas TaxID=2601811 RepID=A0A8K0PHD0_9PEZI|nr:hypothetical protein KVT40_004285 [Elsinoe batatas]
MQGVLCGTVDTSFHIARTMGRRTPWLPHLSPEDLMFSYLVCVNIATAAYCEFAVPAKDGDNCQNFSVGWGPNADELVAMNPSLGPNCENGMQVGQEYCVLADGPGPATITTTYSLSTRSTGIGSLDFNQPTGFTQATDTSDTSSSTSSFSPTGRSWTSMAFPTAFPSDAVFTGNFVAIGPSGTMTIAVGNVRPEETSSSTSTSSTNTATAPSAAASGSTSSASHRRFAGGGLMMVALGVAVLVR